MEKLILSICTVLCFTAVTVAEAKTNPKVENLDRVVDQKPAMQGLMKTDSTDDELSAEDIENFTLAPEESRSTHTRNVVLGTRLRSAPAANVANRQNTHQKERRLNERQGALREDVLIQRQHPQLDSGNNNY